MQLFFNALPGAHFSDFTDSRLIKILKNPVIMNSLVNIMLLNATCKQMAQNAPDFLCPVPFRIHC